ncbi:hypothetical protein EJ05DRAFT_227101 [Pseudovirgaria hyperparasitica]|uniref:Fibronectin type-III domain-containing protein n=1 Tax=Pseudovirgaria hyperparasitica TaxID=470096 RepID=A0A6A6VV64_9PEZI|nr:uncharacterized protein EJ05DRAFT_227101 [Pseudovirgaria hyperparasitica]KAF2753157.1 hypothetical protein EJ05DRAFT_227101 [Pseudovirgaria hyperparasitica]
MPLSPWAAVILAVVAIAARLWLPFLFKPESSPQASLMATSELHLRWHPEQASPSIETLFVFSTSWLRTFLAGLALCWLSLRAWQVVSKPAEELTTLLGLEVPRAPVVSLAGVKADGVLLHWKTLERNIVKYIVKMNGVESKEWPLIIRTNANIPAVGNVSQHENAIIISNLQPDRNYTIRIVVLNNVGFRAFSTPINVRTLSISSGEYINGSQQKEEPLVAEDDGYAPAPVVQASRAFSEAFSSTTLPPAMTREHSNSISRSKRSDTARCTSGDVPLTKSKEPEQKMQHLQERLECLRMDIEREEMQIEKEDREFVATKETLQQQKDEIMKVLKERSKNSEDLKKDVSRVERERTAVLTKRVNKERQLKDVQKRRQDMKTDLDTWEREISDVAESIQRLAAEKIEYRICSEAKLFEANVKYADEQAVNKQLEEEIQQKRVAVNQLEDEHNHLVSNDGIKHHMDTRDPGEVEADMQWRLRIQNLQSRYTLAWQMMQQVTSIHQQHQIRAQWYEQRRASQPHLFGSSSPVEGPARSDSFQRRRRGQSIRNEQSTLPTNYMTSAPSFNGAIAGLSPSFSTTSPFLNINNGMTLPLSSHSHGVMSPDLEMLTGGGPMSPTAGDLLPRGLFVDDSERSVDGRNYKHAPEGSRPILPLLPGLGAPQTLEQSSQHPSAQGPSSPISVNSRPASIFASPRESTTHLALNFVTNDLVDSDKRSIRSTSSSLRNTGTRFGSLFGFNRQRGKTWDHDGPALGSLKKDQTQSLPRQDIDQDPIGTPQRRGSHSNSWVDQMSSAFTRKPPSVEAAESSIKQSAPRRRGLNMFGFKGDALNPSSLSLDRPASPRPASIKASVPLPRPSTESQNRFGWPIEGLWQHRNSPLGSEWGLPPPSTTSWSRHPSRRPSVQYGQSSSGRNRDSGVFDDGIAELSSPTMSPIQAPIGTRPASSQAQIPPTPPKALNPAAPNFNISLFSRDKTRAEKSAADTKAEKAAEKAAAKAEKAAAKEERALRKNKEKEKKALEKEAADRANATPTPATIEPSISITTPHLHSSSPPDARSSRDNRSFSTADGSPRNSLDRVTSLSASTTDAPASSIGKESFMSKLSRKSSSGKFNFPGFTSSKAKKQSGTSEVGTPDEIDEDSHGMPGFTPRSMESGFEGHKISNSPALGASSGKSSTLSWSSLKRIGKKGDKTPSLHESVTSEGGATTGDEDDAVGLGVSGSISDMREA